MVEQCVNSSKHQFADGPAGCTPMAFTLDKASSYHKSLGLNVSVYHVDPFWSAPPHNIFEYMHCLYESLYGNTYLHILYMYCAAQAAIPTARLRPKGSWPRAPKAPWRRT